MNAIDFIIIYLACGAPFCVYFYLQNRLKSETHSLWLKTTLAFVFWIPFALFIISKLQITKSLFNPNFNKNFCGDIRIEENLLIIQKKIEKLISESSSEISLFEFRQTIERYAGLTLLLQSDNEAVSEQEKEIFWLAKSKNVDIAAICLQRRNRKRLAFHQTKARQDFLQMVGYLFNSISNIRKFENSVIEFVNLLNDFTARDNLEKLFAANLQIGNAQSVRQIERALWKTEIPKPLIIKPISARLQITTTTTSLRSED